MMNELAETDGAQIALGDHWVLILQPALPMWQPVQEIYTHGDDCPGEVHFSFKAHYCEGGSWSEIIGDAESPLALRMRWLNDNNDDTEVLLRDGWHPVGTGRFVEA